MEKIEDYEHYEAFDALVDKFLRNKMTEEEENAFKEDLLSSPDKMQRAKVAALMVQQIQNVGLVRDQKVVDSIKDMSENTYRKVAGLPAKKNIFVLRLVQIAAAACFIGVIIFGGNRYNMYCNTVALGDEFCFAYVPEGGDMRGEGNYRSPVQEGNTLASDTTLLFPKVANGEELSNTIVLLEKIYTQLNENDDADKYALDDVAWKLAIAYLKDGEREKPLLILEDFIKRNQGYEDITGPAMQLIEKIKAL